MTRTPASDEPSDTPEGGRVLRRLGAALGLFFAVWVVLFVTHRALPGVQSGSDQVVERKRANIREGHLFDPQASVRVAVFGDSRVLAGFKPDLFDAELGEGVASYNLGLPGIGAFVSELEVVAAADPPPTHVLLAKPWKRRPPLTWWRLLHDDKKLMMRVFPFRRLPRDLVLFAARSRANGGPVAYYQRVLQLLDDLERDRGYHFIESQSRFKGHRLPADFSVPSDDPARAEPREFPTDGPELDVILELQRKVGFKVIVVPAYVREGARAALAPVARPEIEALGIHLVGPDYWLYPQPLFSDVQHLNEEGADRYTRDLAALLKPVLLEGGR